MARKGDLLSYMRFATDGKQFQRYQWNISFMRIEGYLACYMEVRTDEKHFSGTIVTKALFRKGIWQSKWYPVLVKNNSNADSVTKALRKKGIWQG